MAAAALQVQATVAFLRGDPAAAHRRLLDASELIGASDKGKANELLIEAVHTGWYAGGARAGRGVPGSRDCACGRRRWNGCSCARWRRSSAAADPSDPGGALAEARSAAASNVPGLVLVSRLALLLGQDQAAQQIGGELSRDLRAAGQIGWLPTALFYVGSAQAYGGRHEVALHTVAEGLRLARDTGQQRWVDALAEPLALLAAARGDEQLCRQLADEALSRASGRPGWCRGPPRRSASTSVPVAPSRPWRGWKRWPRNGSLPHRGYQVHPRPGRGGGTARPARGRRPSPSRCSDLVAEHRAGLDECPRAPLPGAARRR